MNGIESIVSGTAVLGIVGWVITRQVKKLVNHADDRSVHLNPETKLVSEPMCNQTHTQIEKDNSVIKKDITHVHRRMDNLFMQQSDSTKEILKAINGNKKP